VETSSDVCALLLDEYAHRHESDSQALTPLLRLRAALLTWDISRDSKGCSSIVADCTERAADATDVADCLDVQRQLLAFHGHTAELVRFLLDTQDTPIDAAEALNEASLVQLYWLGDLVGARGTLSLSRDLPKSPRVARDIVTTELLCALLQQDYKAAATAAHRMEDSRSGLYLAAAQVWDTLRDAQHAELLLAQAREGGQQERCFSLQVELDIAITTHDRQRELALLERISDSIDDPIERSVLKLESSLLTRDTSPSAALDALDAAEDQLLETHLDRWTRRMLAGQRRRAALLADNPDELARAYLDLAFSCVDSAPCYRLRAAQLLDLLGDNRSEQLLGANLTSDRACAHSALQLELIMLKDGRLQELARLYQELAELIVERRADFFRRAALLTERALGAPEDAASLRASGLAIEHDPFGLGDLQRYYRSQNALSRLAESYVATAEHAVADESRGMWLSMAACLYLKRGNVEQAKRCARSAIQIDPQDLLSLAILAVICRGDQPGERRAFLIHLQTLVRAPQNRVMLLRDLALEDDDNERAKELLYQAVEIAPDDLDMLTALSVVLERTGEFAEATAIFERIARASASQKDAASAFFRIGKLHVDKLEDDRRAITAFQRALECDSDHLEAIYALADIYERQGNIVGLLPLLDARIDRITGRQAADLHLRRARALEGDGQVDAAFDALKQALFSDPHNQDLLETLGSNARRNALWDQALETLEQLEQTAVQHPMGIELKLEAMINLQRFEQAAELLQHLIEDSQGVREQADRLYDLGRLQEQIGDQQAATDNYLLAVERFPAHRPSLGALRRQYRAHHNWQALLDILQRELGWAQDTRDRVDVLLDLANTALQLPDADEAVSALRQVIELDPKNSEAFNGLQRVYEQQGDLVELAHVLVRRCQQVDDAADVKGEHLARAAEMFAMAGLDEDARAAFRASLEICPENRDTFTAFEAFAFENALWKDLLDVYRQLIDGLQDGLARVYRPIDLYMRRGQLQLQHLGQPGEASASFLYALELDAKNEAAIKALHGIYAEQQDWVGLIEIYERRAQWANDNELFALESLRQAARLASEHLDPNSPDTLRLWSSITKLDPADQEALEILAVLLRERWIPDRLVEVLESQGQLEQDQQLALELRLEAARLCEYELDDPDRAAKSYESARELDEHNEESLKALARIYEATGRWESCISALTDLVMIEADPDERSLLYFKCGSIMEARFSDDRRATELYELSLQESQGCLPALHGLRDIHLNHGRWEQALATLEMELAIWEGEREQAGVLARMGQILESRVKRHQQAIERYEQALELDPNCQPALVALFEIADERGDTARAARYAEKLATRMQEQADPAVKGRFFRRRAMLLREGGSLAEAARACAVALDAAPDDARSLTVFAALFREQPDACDFATKLAQLVQKNRRAGATKALCRALAGNAYGSALAGDVDVARATYEEALQLDPTAHAPVAGLVDLELMLGNHDRALSLLEQHTKSDAPLDERRESFSMLADLLAERFKKLPEAIAARQSLASQEPDNYQLKIAIAHDQLALGQHQQALATIEKALQIVEQLPATVGVKLHHCAGAIHAAKRDTKQAIEQLEHALAINPVYVPSVLLHARQLLVDGARQEALASLDKTLKALAKEETASSQEIHWRHEIQRTIGSIALANGDVQHAIACFAALAETGSAEDRVMLGELSARRNGPNAVVTAQLRRVISSAPSCHSAFELLARLYALKGEGDRELILLRACRALGLGKPEDQAKLAQLAVEFPFRPQRTIDDGLIESVRTGQASKEVDHLWRIVRRPLRRIFRYDSEEELKRTSKPLDGASELNTIKRCAALFELDVSVMTQSAIPLLAMFSTDDAKTLYVHPSIRRASEAEIRYIIAKVCATTRLGYGLLSSIANDSKTLMISLLADLLAPAHTRAELSVEILGRLPPEAVRRIEHLSNRAQGRQAAISDLVQQWLASVEQHTTTLALLSADDLHAAILANAKIEGAPIKTLGMEQQAHLAGEAQWQMLLDLYLADEFIAGRRALMRE
jgi:tetratricopeptide (TPR) repeat protein